MASGTSAIYSRVVALRLSQRNRTAWLLDLDRSINRPSPVADCWGQAKAAARVTGAAVVLLSSRMDISALRRLLMGGFLTREQCVGRG